MGMSTNPTPARSRRPAGTPTGGQFAPEAHAEPEVALGTPPPGPESIPETDGNGDTLWRTADGQLHRTDGPAIEWANGTREWFVDGQLHREDGPAIEYADGAFAKPSWPAQTMGLLHSDPLLRVGKSHWGLGARCLVRRHHRLESDSDHRTACDPGLWKAPIEPGHSRLPSQAGDRASHPCSLMVVVEREYLFPGVASAGGGHGDC